MTTGNLHPHWSFSGYGAYGTRDKKWFYSGQAAYSFNKRDTSSGSSPSTTSPSSTPTM